MVRVIRLLPVLIPVARMLLRNPKVRELLRLKPVPQTGQGSRRV